MPRSYGYDDVNQEHHPNCPAHPDHEFEERRDMPPVCECEELALDQYELEMERRVDRERDRWTDEEEVRDARE